MRSERVDTGQFVRRGTSLGTIYAVDFAEVRLPIQDEELAYLDLSLAPDDDAPGTPVLLHARFAGSDYTWEGSVVRTEGELDAASRMVHVVARVADPYRARDGRPPLSVGMFVDADILGTTITDAVRLPRSAMRGDDQVMVVVDGNRLQLRQVDVLRRERDDVLISSGLSAGELVCVSPLPATVDGMRVRIMERDEARLRGAQAISGRLVNGPIAWFAENHVARQSAARHYRSGRAGEPAVHAPGKPSPTSKPTPSPCRFCIWVLPPRRWKRAFASGSRKRWEGLEGVDRLRSTASEGACLVTVELFESADTSRALDDVKNRVDAIDTFPEETEQPIITLITPQRPVLDLAVTGPADERELKVIGQRVRDDIAALPAVTQVSLAHSRPYEISIELAEASLRRHGLTFDQVASAIRGTSLDLPGGTIRSRGGDIPAAYQKVRPTGGRSSRSCWCLPGRTAPESGSATWPG